MDVDWERVRHDAQNTPRSILQEALERADSSHAVVVIMIGEYDVTQDETWWQVSGSAAEALGLLEIVKAHLLRDML